MACILPDKGSIHCCLGNGCCCKFCRCDFFWTKRVQMVTLDTFNVFEI